MLTGLSANTVIPRNKFSYFFFPFLEGRKWEAAITIASSRAMYLIAMNVSIAAQTGKIAETEKIISGSLLKKSTAR